MNSLIMNKLLIICGPTGTGKTKLAIGLAKKFNGELVNADSRQVYKGLDALTGKDRSDEVPIWLYDVVEPTEEFSAAHFVRLARPVIEDLYKRGKLPIVVGGTGFYLRALTDKIDTLLIPPNKKLRDRLVDASIDQLQKKLRRADPGKWKRMNESDRKNPRRLVRAIEVAAVAAVPNAKPKQDVLWIGLSLARVILKDRIGNRVLQRFDQATKEVKEGLPPILGAGPLLDYVRGQTSKEQAIAQWIQFEYAYAKRQMTWFAKESSIQWFDISVAGFEGKVEALVREWYTP